MSTIGFRPALPFSLRMKDSCESNRVRLRTSWLTLFLLFSLLEHFGLLHRCMPTGAAALSHDGMVLLGLKTDAELTIRERDPDTPTKVLPDGTSVSLRQSEFFATWNENDTTPCDWIGVSCTAGSDRVQGLRLSDWSLLDFNFSRLSSLSNLEELDLSSNLIGFNGFGGMTDKILEALSGTRLSRLDLSRNLIRSWNWGSSTNCGKHLRHLSLEGNSLRRMPRVDCFPQLQHLSVAGNHLSGSIPRQLFRNSTSLISLDLSHNRFTGDIPNLLGLTKLQSLDLSHNQFTKFRPSDDEFLSLKNLRSLDFSGNRLTGTIPSGIANLPRIVTLDVSSNQLYGEIPPGIRLNTSTVLFNLSNNMLSGTIPRDLLLVQDSDGFGWSGTVNLSRNFLVGEVPEPGNRSRFHGLDLSYNPLEGTVPALLQVQHMWLQHTQLGGDINDFLANADMHMKELRVKGSAFHGELNMSRLSPTSHVYFMDLSNTEIVIRSTVDCPDPLQTMLQRFPYLQELRLTGIDLTGAHPTWLNRSPLSKSLQVLDLSNTSVGAFLPDVSFNATYFPALKQLNLSSNRLQGPVPASIAQLVRTIVVDLSNNPGLCGDPLPPCSSGSNMKMWVRHLLMILIPSVCISVTSLLLLVWRWRVYSQRHKQDADLIATLLQSKDNTMLMSLKALKKATANFASHSEIGVGGFGKVYVGQLSDGTKVAVKRSLREGSEQDKQQFLNEVRILSQVHHRNLVKLLGCCMENKVALLVFEYVPNGDLREHLQGKKGAAPLGWRQRLLVAVQTADALAYLHSAANPPIFHRDVKSSNILLDQDLNAKVSDFGMSKLAPIGATHVSTAAIQGTMGYIDPQYYRSGRLTAKSDVYSFGVVLMELISAQPVIDEQRGEEDEALVSLANLAVNLVNAGDLQQLVDPALLGVLNSAAGHESILGVGKLAVKCLAFRSKDRPSMQEVWKQLQALWFTCCTVPIFDDDICPAYIHLDIGNELANSEDQVSLPPSLPSLGSCFSEGTFCSNIEMAGVRASSMPTSTVSGLSYIPCYVSV